MREQPQQEWSSWQLGRSSSCSRRGTEARLPSSSTSQIRTDSRQTSPWPPQLPKLPGVASLRNPEQKRGPVSLFWRLQQALQILEAVLWESSLAWRLLATLPLHTLVAGHIRSCSPSVQTSCLGRSRILGCVTIVTIKSNGSGMCPNVHGVKGVKQATASSHILSFSLIG